MSKASRTCGESQHTLAQSGLIARLRRGRRTACWPPHTVVVLLSYAPTSRIAVGEYSATRMLIYNQLNGGKTGRSWRRMTRRIDNTVREEDMLVIGLSIPADITLS